MYYIKRKSADLVTVQITKHLQGPEAVAAFLERLRLDLTGQGGPLLASVPAGGTSPTGTLGGRLVTMQSPQPIKEWEGLTVEDGANGLKLFARQVYDLQVSVRIQLEETGSHSWELELPAQSLETLARCFPFTTGPFRFELSRNEPPALEAPKAPKVAPIRRKGKPLPSVTMSDAPTTYSPVERSTELDPEFDKEVNTEAEPADSSA